MGTFEVGSIVQRREVLHGQVWMTMPVRVIADDEVLAVWVEDGAPFTFPPHPFGPHPWSGQERWGGCGVLQLYRDGDRYSVWGFFAAGRVDRWYVNFERPYRRGDSWFDTDDHGLDIVIVGDEWRWKDRDDVAEQVAVGRITEADAAAVWREAEGVAAALDRGERWWMERWGKWRPGVSGG